MKFLKSNFFLFCFLFFCLSLKGEVSKSNACINASKKHCSVIPSPVPSNESTEIVEIEGILSSCLRVTERTMVCFQNYENISFFFLSSFRTYMLFSTACYRWYIKKQINEVNCCPLYICYHRLLI